LTCLNIGIANAAEFSTKAKSAYLVDYDSGDEIVSKNANELMPPSSMLKLMTLTVLFDQIKSGNLKMDDVLTVSENADYKNPLWYPASKMCLVTGQKITVRDAILGIIVLSAGDASVTVAEHLAGNENKFSELMHKKALEIGMEKSTFGNASGLPNENNLMTSKELAMLAKYIIDEYPDIYPMFATKRFEFNDTKTDWCRDWTKTHTMNYNRLLFSMPGADGLKTGHTDDGGYGVVASAKIGGRRLIGVINGFRGKGHDALAEEMKKLLNYGYKNTQTKTFFRAGDVLLKIPVWYGRYPTVDATTKENIAITLPKDYSLKNIRVLARYDEPVAAPVKVGQQIGEIVIEKNGDIVKRIPMIAKERVRKIQLFGRVLKNISVMIWGK
ncbi:MAG: D-alanyl-D-alanine carboxypeptidase, partial [Alphaproteobacteria bacterium]|nr:D-alanyl-D-alanine carboxypeptidase [Alphaproteobacteria bacterium]